MFGAPKKEKEKEKEKEEGEGQGQGPTVARQHLPADHV